MVKVHGDGLKCGTQGEDNISLMQWMEAQGGGIMLKDRCAYYANYIWEGKQLCLYECSCSNAPCYHVQLTINIDRHLAAHNISICEFGVLS